MNVTTPNLSRSAFRAWLASKPADEKVGETFQIPPKRCASCPLARWLRETWEPAAEVGVGFASESRDRGDDQPMVPLPAWASEFIRAVDAENRKVDTAADCLRALDAIPEEA